MTTYIQWEAILRVDSQPPKKKNKPLPLRLSGVAHHLSEGDEGTLQITILPGEKNEMTYIPYAPCNMTINLSQIQDAMNQVIQVVTKLYPWSLEVTIHLWKDQPSQKGHKELLGVLDFCDTVSKYPLVLASFTFLIMTRFGN